MKFLLLLASPLLTSSFLPPPAFSPNLSPLRSSPLATTDVDVNPVTSSNVPTFESLGYDSTKIGLGLDIDPVKLNLPTRSQLAQAIAEDLQITQQEAEESIPLFMMDSEAVTRMCAHRQRVGQMKAQGETWSPPENEIVAQVKQYGPSLVGFWSFSYFLNNLYPRMVASGEWQPIGNFIPHGLPGSLL